MKHLLAHYMKRFFSDYLASQRGLSENTILAYRDAIKLLLCYIADTFSVSVEKLSVEHIKERQVLAFLNYLEQVRQCSPRTRNARLAAIRSLFMYIAREEPALLQQCRKICAIPLKKTTHIKKDHLGENEIQAVLDAVDLNSRTGGRDKAMLLLLYNTGARVSEIVTLKCHDLRLNQGGQVRLSGKGKKRVSVQYGRKLLRHSNRIFPNVISVSKKMRLCFLMQMVIRLLDLVFAISSKNMG